MIAGITEAVTMVLRLAIGEDTTSREATEGMRDKAEKKMYRDQARRHQQASLPEADRMTHSGHGDLWGVENSSGMREVHVCEALRYHAGGWALLSG